MWTCDFFPNKAVLGDGIRFDVGIASIARTENAGDQKLRDKTCSTLTIPRDDKQSSTSRIDCDVKRSDLTLR
jgi:hypothetical protein